MRKKQKTMRIICNVTAILIALIMLFPLIWIVLNSFKYSADIFAKPITLLPKRWTFEAYTKYLFESHLLRGYRNTFLIAVGALAIGMILGVTSAYGLARYRMKFSKIVLLLFLLTQMLPASLMLTPMYLTYSKMGILNSYLAPILSVATTCIPFIVVTTRPFFLSLPKELDEAARIDGCNTLQSFLLVMVPIAKTGLLTAAALSFIFGWNDLAYSMTFNTKEELRPLTSIIYSLINSRGIKWNAVMGLATVSIAPIVVMFLALQDAIIGGLTAGAVKS